jgi:hypothetical protein
MLDASQERGTTIAELLVVSLIFSIILGICMFATITAFRMFQQTNARQQLQRDAAAIFAWMQRDLEVSNLNLTVGESRTSGTDDRFRIGMVGMADWEEPILRDSIGHPAWNRVIVYSATRDPDTGLLVRQSVNVPGGLAVNAGTVSDLMKDSATQDADLRRLASGVKIFRASPSMANESVQIELVLTQQTSQLGTGGQRREVLEIQTSVRPKNTFPKI